MKGATIYDYVDVHTKVYLGKFYDREECRKFHKLSKTYVKNYVCRVNLKGDYHLLLREERCII